MYGKSMQLNLSMFKSIDIEFSDVDYEIPSGFLSKKKSILKGINGRFKSGEMSAIMGPSGAGKSTLLNILTGFKHDKNLKGNIHYLDERGNKESCSMHKKYSRYILQEDYLPRLFTINEIMMISVNLKIDNNINHKTKQILIDDILITLDLIDKKNTLTNKLSGGERKRLSIALELVDNPPIMFLDEPTTGLDSYSSFQCIKMLQNLARSYRTIICTIHQPSATIYEMFDHIYLIADGRCMYDGTAKDTVSYFAELGLRCPKYHNPADYIIEVVNNEYGNMSDQLVATVVEKRRMAAMLEKSSKRLSANEENYINRVYNKDKKMTVPIDTPSELKRLFVLFNRSVTLFHRDWTLFYFRVLIHFSISLLLGIFYLNSGINSNLTLSNIKFLAGIIIYLSYTSLMPAVLKVPMQLDMLKKEEFNNWYQLRTYYLALMIIDLPVQIILSLTYCTALYFLSQPLEYCRFFMFFGIAALTNIISDSLGFIIGSLLTPVNGIFVSSIVLGVCILFEGCVIMLNDIPNYFYYFHYFSYMKYSYEGLIQSTYGYSREKLDCSDDTIYCPFRIPKIIIKELAMVDERYWFDLLVLIIFFVFYRTVAYYTLKWNLTKT